MGALLLLGILLPLLGLTEIGGSSEAREAHIVSVMLRYGEWILPTRNGILPSKPPLFHWLAALVAILFGGLTEFTVRIPSALAGSGMVGLVIARVSCLGMRAGGNWARHAPCLGLAAAFILTSTYAFALMLGDARVDMVFAFFSLAAVLSVLRRFEVLLDITAPALSLVRSQDFTLFYVFCALAVLTKGPLGIVLPVVVIFVCCTYLAGMRAATILLLKPRLGWLLFLLITVPWYGFALMTWQAKFVGRQLIFENVNRFLGGELVNTEPWWFYLPSFMRSAFPWSLLFIYCLLFGILTKLAAIERPAVTQVHIHQVYSRLKKLYLLWFLSGTILFSLAAGKRHSYLMPLLPALSIYLALELHDWWLTRSDQSKGLIRSLTNSLPYVEAWVCAVCIVVLEILKWQNLASLFHRLPLGVASSLEWLIVFASPVQILLVAMLGGFVALKTLRRKNFLLQIVLGWAIFAALFCSILTAGLGLKYHLKGFREMAHQIGARIHSDDALYALRAAQDELMDPLLFYLQRPVVIIDPKDSELLCTGGSSPPSSGRQFVLVKHDMAEAISAKFPGRLRMVASYEQLADKIEGLHERDIVLFECQAQGAGRVWTT